MLCERCQVEMDKFKFSLEELSVGRGHYSCDGKKPGEPVVARSVYICSKCGKMEFNVNE